MVYYFTQNFESVNNLSKIKGCDRHFYFRYLKGNRHEARIFKGKMLFFNSYPPYRRLRKHRNGGAAAVPGYPPYRRLRNAEFFQASPGTVLSAV